MDERLRRLWAGAEAEAMGWGGLIAVARATGMAISTVTLGRNEVRAGATPTADLVQVRRRGGGRRRHELVHPELVPALRELVEPATRGGPESPLRWTNKSTIALTTIASGPKFRSEVVFPTFNRSVAGRPTLRLQIG
jgi:hypothetical protein